MKYIIGLYLLFCVASCQQNEQATNTSNDENLVENPQKKMNDTTNYTFIQWIDSVHNLGVLTKGEKADINYRFRNAGDKPLFIISATPGCGCTVADYPKEAIAPGEEAVIKAGYDTENQHVGAFHKSISVVTNTKGNMNHTLVFSGEIITKENEQQKH
ncbi:DUF1573 domain-containing protein [Aridibaculum aurantiacum]|uniref:DUF1573 domain-containing protein n=1 Tax=Aridibaculum aurantiacum TaxID=2810307 RepID=UPI001A967680|nr:DUF1573 domain-containing protein [Aridibaculum aurantiacum]